jgi:hypothetical protein
VRRVRFAGVVAVLMAVSSVPWAHADLRLGRRVDLGHDRVAGTAGQPGRWVPRTTSATDGPLTNDTAYAYSLRAYYRSWTSAPVTASLTPSC